MNKTPSPCTTCTRVKCPEECHRNNCTEWAAWWREKWDATRLLFLTLLK
jgi:hypothetical protein